MRKERGFQYAERNKHKILDGLVSWWAFNQTYTQNFYLIIGQENKMKKVIPDFDHSVSGYTHTNEEQKIIIWLPKKGETETFVHELYHAVNQLYLLKGIKPDADNDEVGAYLISWLFRVFHRAVEN